MEYNWVKLGDIAEVKNGYAYKSKDYTDIGIPIVKIKNIVPPYVNLENCNYVSKHLYKDTLEYSLMQGDILISMTGSGVSQMNSAVGKVGKVNFKCKALQNQRVGKIQILDDKKYNKNFLYYYLSQEKLLKYFVYNSTGSANQANISKKLIENTPVPNIKLIIQKRIVSILDTLDKKIEVNNKIISNLEKQAQAIFKSWFVDFEPFQDGEFVESELGLIPKGWEVKYLLELTDFKGGSQPPKSEHIYEPRDGYVRFIQNRDYDLSNNHLTFIKKSKKNKLATEKDILMDKYGEAGKVRFGISGAYNVALSKIDPFDINNREYIRRFLEQKNVQKYIYNSSIASTRPSVSKNTLVNLKLILPDHKILKKFSNISNNIIDMELTLRKYNQKLAEIRDILLPKLMSGEIDVSNIKIGEEDRYE